jgi:hypothetical protein
MDLDIILFGTKGVVCIRHRIKRFNATLKLLLLVSMIGSPRTTRRRSAMSLGRWALIPSFIAWLSSDMWCFWRRTKHCSREWCYVREPCSCVPALRRYRYTLESLMLTASLFLTLNANIIIRIYRWDACWGEKREKKNIEQKWTISLQPTCAQKSERQTSGLQGFFLGNKWTIGEWIVRRFGLAQIIFPNKFQRPTHTCMVWWGTLVPHYYSRRSEANLNSWIVSI